jgi:molecular chaperone GrpE (heat shock protein)
MVEMLDTAERLTSLQVGAFQGIPKDLVAALEQVRSAGEGFRDAIAQTLERRKVQRINLETGERPPVETTQVVSREDNTTTDDYVIAKIVSPGYRMDDTVIRRAAVTVVTRQTTTGEEHGVKPGN